MNAEITTIGMTADPIVNKTSLFILVPQKEKAARAALSEVVDAEGLEPPTPCEPRIYSPLSYHLNYVSNEETIL